MKIFIASPLFNPAQHAVLDGMEKAITEAGHTFYSARHHSGSQFLTPEQKRVLSNWDPIFDSNVEGLDGCDVCIANIGYQLPEGSSINAARIMTPEDFNRDAEWWDKNSVSVFSNGIHDLHLTRLQLPDAGTVWEMGYMRAQHKLVIGYHPEAQPGVLNLMLSHGCDGIVTGEENLVDFLSGERVKPYLPMSVLKRIDNLRNRAIDEDRLSQGQVDTHYRYRSRIIQFGEQLNWRATRGFEAESKDVE